VQRVTLDTNVFISGLISSRGVCARLLALAEGGAFAIQLSEPIQDEVSTVLARDFDWSEERVSQARTFLSSISQHVTPHVELDVVKRDPPDNRILECSQASKSEYIVTSDKDLLSLGVHEGATIIKPSEYLTVMLQDRSQ
jgi:uncharacterized protein